MTSRKKLLKTIQKAASERGLAFEKSARKGGNHEIWKLDGMTVPVPRHCEIADITSQRIYKEAEEKLGKDWWK